jgi:hypothetical protein
MDSSQRGGGEAQRVEAVRLIARSLFATARLRGIDERGVGVAAPRFNRH